jgi:hypothetical protein
VMGQYSFVVGGGAWTHDTSGHLPYIEITNTMENTCPHSDGKRPSTPDRRSIMLEIGRVTPTVSTFTIDINKDPNQGAFLVDRVGGEETVMDGAQTASVTITQATATALVGTFKVNFTAGETTGSFNLGAACEF